MDPAAKTVRVAGLARAEQECLADSEVRTRRREREAVRRAEQRADPAPEAERLTEREGREWRGHLLTVRNLSAASVNLRLAAWRGLARHYGQSLRVRGVKRVAPPLNPLNSRELGRPRAAR